MSDKRQGHVPEEVRAGLSKIGLGRRYHDMTLESFGDLGMKVLEWARSPEFIHDLKAGAGRHFYGIPKAHDIFMLTAKAAHLRGRRVKVISLSVLVNEVTSTDISRDLDEAQAVFLTPFFRDEYTDPLTTGQRLAVEDFLMERLDQAYSVFTSGDRSLEISRAWWSTTLIRRLQASNPEIEVR